MKENNSEIIQSIKKALEKELLHIECEDNQSDSLLQLIAVYFPSVGFVNREEYFYNRLSMGEMIELFADLSGKSGRKYEAIQEMQLQDYLTMRGEKMSHSLKKRLAIAREIIFNRDLLVIQEPILNLDDESRRIIINWLEEYNKPCITTTHSLKHALLLNGSIYSLSENQLVEHYFEEEIELENMKEISSVVVRKITGKIENRTFLFDPFEIDYIESNTGSNYLKVKGEEFLSGLSMDGLEEQLKPFGFFRSHRSYLVNLQRVHEFEKWSKNSYILKLNDREETIIPLSKGRVEALKEVYFIH